MDSSGNGLVAVVVHETELRGKRWALPWVLFLMKVGPCIQFQSGSTILPFAAMNSDGAAKAKSIMRRSHHGHVEALHLSFFSSS